jgi:hypothetical protein
VVRTQVFAARQAGGGEWTMDSANGLLRMVVYVGWRKHLLNLHTSERIVVSMEEISPVRRNHLYREAIVIGKSFERS